MEMLTGELKTQYKKPYLGLCGLLYSVLLKVNNSVAAKVEYLTGKKIIKNIKIQLPAISMRVRLPQSLTSMSIHLKTIYKSVVFCAIGATGSRSSSLYLSF